MPGLIQKYNVAGPRYTSFPTLPFWHDTPTEFEWKKQLLNTFSHSNKEEGISLYIHLPYCESLCTYCGCNTRITVNHKVERPYMESVLTEWSMYIQLFNERPIIREIHLGGGTPTFFSPENLKFLIEGILEDADLHPHYEFSFEAHPKSTSRAHLEQLYALGFRRLSLGIQDFDPIVQDIINRIQPFEMVETAVRHAREVGFESINFDLIYGLPLQTLASVKESIALSRKLSPDRIAFYSYAHVPWIKASQRRFTEMDLPSGEIKRALYEAGKEMFEEAGYVEIGMDHFALPTDALYSAMKNNSLHRNFMGYTTGQTQVLVGLGVSSISDSWGCFVQNVKTVEGYQALVSKGKFPFFKGHVLNDKDLKVRKEILDAMCRMKFDLAPLGYSPEQTESLLSEFKSDGLVQIEDSKVEILEKGRPFVRNICMAFDFYLSKEKSGSKLFSQTV